MIVKIKKIHQDAKEPNYAYKSDAGLDLYSVEDKTLISSERHAFATGISLEIPHGYVGLIWDKSSIGIRHGLKTLGGVVDAGFRGEIKIGLVNLSNQDFEIKKGEKIAQILIQKIERPQIEVVKELSESHRGDGAFGSSGRK